MTRPGGERERLPHHVLIIGSGFGGLFAAKSLRRAPVRVTVVDHTNHHLFQPLLYQLATGILSEGQIAPPTRDVLRNYPSTEVVVAEVTGFDPSAHRVTGVSFGRSVTFSYDSLIVAAGAVTDYFGHDEFRENSLPMKSLGDALHLRRKIFAAFELAEAEPDRDRQRVLTTFVVVGGGPTGVEMAGQLVELSKRALRRNYRHFDPRTTRVVLVEGTDRLVAMMGESLSGKTARDLSGLGVELLLGTMVTAIGDGWVEVKSHQGAVTRIDAATTVWAAGTRASPLGAKLAEATGATLERSGRVVVQPDCSIAGHPEIFVVGDLMALNDLPGVAEVAMQSGRHAARTIRRRLKGATESRAFAYRDLGTLATISRFKAVAKIGPIRVDGFIGWLLWLVVHIAFLTGFKNRLGALARWTVSFLGRGRSERALTDHSLRA